MRRDHYQLFTSGKIAGLRLANRLVRSATWDPCLLAKREMRSDVLDVYERLAVGGVGLIITGGLPVFQENETVGNLSGLGVETYPSLRIQGIEALAKTVHRASAECKVVAQLETGNLGCGPSELASPYRGSPAREMTLAEIEAVRDSFVEAIADMQACGFDGVQLHAAHRSLLSRFLSPYTNRRTDVYGGSIPNRARLIREIVAKAREKVGYFPILVKMNGTDYLEGGTDSDSFSSLGDEIARAGVDAIEVSGGMWECLLRSPAELGFLPVPSPEAHTRLNRPETQSYFLKYAESLQVGIPVILVGGNRDAERLERILRGGKVDFISLSRPLIGEPDLPKRWLEGRGRSRTDCISCNACLYEMIVHPGAAEPALVRCVFKHDKKRYHQAQEWLTHWVEKNRIPTEGGQSPIRGMTFPISLGYDKPRETNSSESLFE